MTREEYQERFLQHVRQEAAAPSPVQQQYQARDFYSRVRITGDEGRHLDSDWTGSSGAGRTWGGSRWSGGRQM